MKTRNLLVAFALPTLFAACTAEEIVNQADNSAVLANRALLGDLSVKIENPVASRASWSEEELSWGEFSEEDVFSGAVVDAARGTVDNNLLTNYIYKDVDGSWETTSQMVEGIYSFYSYKGIVEKNDRKPVAFDLTAQTTDLDNPTQVIDDNQLFFSPLYNIEAKNTTADNTIALPLTFYPYHSIGAMKMANETGQNLLITQIIATGEFAAKGAILPTKLKSNKLYWEVRKGEDEYKLNYKTGKTEFTAKEIEKIWQTGDLDNIKAIDGKAATGETESMSRVMTLNCDSWEWADGEEIMAYMVVPANAKITQIEINVVDEDGEAKVIRVEEKTDAKESNIMKKEGGISIASTGISKQEYKRSMPVSVFGYTSANKPKSITAKEENLKDAVGYYIDNKEALIDLVNASRGNIEVYNFGELYIDAEIAEVIKEYTGGVVLFKNPIEIKDAKEIEISNIEFTTVTVKGEDETENFDGTTAVFEDGKADVLIIEAGADVTLEAGTYDEIVNNGKLSVNAEVEESCIHTYGALTIYNETHDITMTQGTLKFVTYDENENGKVDAAEKYTAKLPAFETDKYSASCSIAYEEGVTLNVGETAVVTSNGDYATVALSLNDELSVEKNAVLTIGGDASLEVDGDVLGQGEIIVEGTMTNNGEAEVKITNEGTLYNNDEVENVINNGEIIAGKRSETNVKGTTVTAAQLPGRIDNTNGAIVEIKQGVNQIVYYTVENSNTDELEEIEFEKFAVNTLNVRGTLELDRAFTAPTAEGGAEIAKNLIVLKNLHLENGAEIEIEKDVNVFFTNVYLEGDAYISGWSKSRSSLTFDQPNVNIYMVNKCVSVNDNASEGYTLTIENLDVKGVSDVMTFFTKKETGWHAEGSKYLTAIVETDDADFYHEVKKGGDANTDIMIDDIKVEQEYVLVEDEDELMIAVKNGENVKLEQNIELTKTLVVKEDLTINLGSYELTMKQEVNNTGGNTNRTIAVVVEDAEVTVEGDGWMKGTGNYVLAAGKNGEVIIEGGKFDGTVYAKDNGEVTINGGYFQRSGIEMTKYAKPQYTCLNVNGDATGEIVVKGGTFKNFNPACNYSENPQVNFVHQDYKVTVKNLVTGEDETNKVYEGATFAEQAFGANVWNQSREYKVVIED